MISEQISPMKNQFFRLRLRPFIHSTANLPVSGGHSPRVKVSSGIAGIPGCGSRRVADSKLTSFAPLTKRRAILSWILSFRNLIEPHHGGSAGRRTIVELLSSLTNHRVASEHPFSMISARVRRDISNRENRGGVSGSRGRSNSSN